MRWVLTSALAAGLLICECGCDQVQQRDVAGEYFYHCDDPRGLSPQWDEHRWNRVVLKPDGSYVATQPVSGPQDVQEEGMWTFVENGRRQGVGIGRGYYPLILTRKEIRLLINDDLAQWFAKTRG